MKYNLSNEQMILLGSLLNYEKVVGLENNIGDIGLEALKEKWKQCEQALIHKKLLYYTPNGRLEIDQPFLMVLDSMMNPDIVFIIHDLLKEEEVAYFYIKKNRAVYMKNQDECEVEVFEKLSLFIISLSQHLGLNPRLQCARTVESIPLDRLSEIEVEQKGKLVTGIKFKNGIDETWLSMRTFSNENGNYLIQYDQASQKEEVLVVKGNLPAILSQLFTFDGKTTGY